MYRSGSKILRKILDPDSKFKGKFWIRIQNLKENSGSGFKTQKKVDPDKKFEENFGSGSAMFCSFFLLKGRFQGLLFLFAVCNVRISLNLIYQKKSTEK